MSNSTSADTTPNDHSDWNHAWDVIARLAAARGTALYDNTEQRHGDPISGSHDPSSGAFTAAYSPELFAPVAADQLARDIAEIEKAAAAISPNQFDPVAPDQLALAIAEIETAAAALRLQEPSLEERRLDTESISEPRKSRSIWVLISSIWLSALLIVSGAIGTLAFLFS